MPEVTPAPVKKTPEAKLFEHKGSKVFILVPADEHSARTVLDYIEPFVLDLTPAPKVVNELRLGLTGEGKIIYVAVPETKRVVKDRKVSAETTVKVSSPIDCSKFSTEGTEDGLESVDVVSLQNEIDKAARPFSARHSADGYSASEKREDLSKRRIRLYTT